MGIAGSLVIIVLVWWLAFFSMLSVGIETQIEAGSVEPGTEPSAPTRHFQLWKALASLAISITVWAVIFAIIYYRVLTFEDLVGIKR